MNRADLKELHYITPIENLSLIFQHGILSNAGSKRLNPKSVAEPGVQARRANAMVPNGRPLHDYANLYICARNPMMYKRRSEKLAVVRVSTDVLDLPGVVIADGNAASGYTAFWPSPAGLARVAKDLVFAENWTSDNPIDQYINARVKCAEVLVPDKVETHFILGLYVPNIDMKKHLAETTGSYSVDIDAHLFFK